jgi:hypothetical protein
MRITGSHITPECRAARTTDGAWDEAVARLRGVYDARLARFPDCTITLWIAVDEPEAVSHEEAS